MQNLEQSTKRYFGKLSTLGSLSGSPKEYGTLIKKDPGFENDSYSKRSSAPATSLARPYLDPRTFNSNPWVEGLGFRV